MNIIYEQLGVIVLIRPKLFGFGEGVGGGVRSVILEFILRYYNDIDNEFVWFLDLEQAMINNIEDCKANKLGASGEKWETGLTRGAANQIW